MSRVFAVLATAACAYAAAKQVPVDLENFLPVTLGEVMVKVESKAPIPDILATCATLKTQLAADILESQGKWNTQNVTFCMDLPAKRGEIDNYHGEIGGFKGKINTTNEDIRQIAQELIPAQKTIVEDHNEDIRKEVEALVTLSNNRLSAYKTYVYERAIYMSALSAMTEIKLWLGTSSLDGLAYNAEGSSSQATSDAFGAGAEEITVAPTEAPTATEAPTQELTAEPTVEPVFLDTKDRMVDALRSKAAASSGITQELLLHVATTVHSAVDTTEMIQMINSIENEMKDNLELLNQKEESEYNSFHMSHKGSRQTTNGFQIQVEAARTEITRLLKEEATYAQRVSEFSSEVADRMYNIEEAQARIDKIEYDCALRLEETTSEVKEFSAELGAIDELVSRLQDFKLTQHQQDALRNETETAGP